jgi:hypothetical protein
LKELSDFKELQALGSGLKKFYQSAG